MFVYKVLWIFTVKCLQLFNKELYVYFVQVPFCESFRSQVHTKGAACSPDSGGLSCPGGQAGARCFQTVTPPSGMKLSLLRTSLLLPRGGVYTW